jgi:hypothetical protein
METVVFAQPAGKIYPNEPMPVPVDWYSLFPNPVVAESILDRIVNTAHHIHMDGKSYRPNKRPGATAEGKKP